MPETDRTPGRTPGRRQPTTRLHLEQLEARETPAIAAPVVDAGGLLIVTGLLGDSDILIAQDNATGEIVVSDYGIEAGRFAPGTVTGIQVTGSSGDNRIIIDPALTLPANLVGGGGNNLLIAGSGPTTMFGSPDPVIAGDPNRINKLYGGIGDDALTAGIGVNLLAPNGGQNNTINAIVGTSDVVLTQPVLVDPANPAIQSITEAFPPPGSSLQEMIAAMNQELAAAQLQPDEVQALIQRAFGATALSNQAIVAVVDRNGRILGVGVGDQVSPTILNNPDLLNFAIDGAVAKARTAAFFGNDQAPLTSRTVQNLSETTITQREVEAFPSPSLSGGPDSTTFGPGTVAPVGIGGHFPRGIANTPQVDLFAIERTNRDSLFHPGRDGVKGTADDPATFINPLTGLPQNMQFRFNIDPAFVPDGQNLFAPESYGYVSGRDVTAQARGLATLPGGIPIQRLATTKPFLHIGGIGVFFPGETGFATEENSVLSTTFDPTKPDLSVVSEFIAFAAVGGTLVANNGNAAIPIGPIGGIAVPTGIGLPAGRIDLVGITLDVFGPGGVDGPRQLLMVGAASGIGQGNVDGVLFMPVAPGGPTSGTAMVNPNAQFLAGIAQSDGWIVMPHDAADGSLTAAEVEAIIAASFLQATDTRAAIRLNLNDLSATTVPTEMVMAVTANDGEVLGLFRMPDATIFSIDVAVAKARNVAYYANADRLQPIDQLVGMPAGTAFTNRTFRYLTQARFPEGIDGALPAPFSILNDGGIDPFTALNVGAQFLTGNNFTTVTGHDTFFPGTNFRDPGNILNQNGIIFFPGSAPLYRNGVLVGGFGISGDGVDQDDVVTVAGAAVLPTPVPLRVDSTFYLGIRLPFQKGLRNPEGGLR